MKLLVLGAGGIGGYFGGRLAEAKAAAEKLKALGKPFLDWAGKAERLSFDVPTQRLSGRTFSEATAITLPANGPAQEAGNGPS